MKLIKSFPRAAVLGAAMMAAGLGDEVVGEYQDLVARKPTNAPTPYLCILDEYGYYAVKGFAETKDATEIVDADTNKKPSEVLPDIFKTALNNDDITFESKPMDISSPAVIYEDEMMKRFSQMNQFMKQGMGDLPKKFTCILNSSSP